MDEPISEQVTSFPEDKFNLQRYIELPVEQRIEMARDFAEHADGSWINVYLAATNRSVKMNEMEASRDQEIDKRMEIEKEQKKFEPVEQLVEFRITLLTAQKMLNEGAISQEKADQEIEKDWQKFINLLDLNTKNSVIDETLNWLKEKMTRGDVVILDSESETNEARKNEVKEWVQFVSSAFALEGLSTIDPSINDQLIIVVDLFPPEMSVGDFLMSLSHERAHDLLNKRMRSIDLEANTKIVFNEFFPMLEEQRMYESLSEDQKLRLSKGNKGQFQTIDRMASEHEYKIQIPGLETPILSSPNKATVQLMYAYLHSTENHARTRKRVLELEMKHDGKSDEEISEALSRMKIVSTPVIDTSTKIEFVRERANK